MKTINKQLGLAALACLWASGVQAGELTVEESVKEPRVNK